MMAMDILKDIWPEWQIENQLGRGSFGVVYKAVRRDHNVESYAAIKVISIPSDASEVDSMRSEGLDMDSTRTYFQGIVNDFVSEIQLMESLKGMQNIVSVEDYKVVEKEGEFGWNIYIRMELLTPFNTYICDKTLVEKEVIKLGSDLCTALEICGKRNIIHRDIKPENIFINDFGYFKIGDFGIARKMENITGGLSQKGTSNYMAPEVVTSSDYDARVDIYSLGIVLYRLLNGNRFPFLDTEEQVLSPNERRNALERRIRGEELPAPCDASPAMANLILRACHFNPDYRFASAAEMKEALISVENGSYKVVDIDSDKTALVKPSVDYGNSTYPYKANKSVNQSVDTFGSKPVTKKKKRKPLKIAAALFVIFAFVGSGVYFSPRLINIFNMSGNYENGESDDAGKDAGINESNDVEIADNLSDEEQIASIIADAEELAADDDYKGALAKVKEGLINYPESELLQGKVDEYSVAIDVQVKESALFEAAEFAKSEDYKSALDLLKKSLEKYENDAEYQSAYDTYSKAYITQVKGDAIKEAEDLTRQDDYLGAIKTIKQTVSAIGEDTELAEILQFYEEVYISNTLLQVDAYMDSKDFDEAGNILGEAIKEFPQSQELSDKNVVLEKSKPKNFIEVCSPYEWNDYTEPDVITMSGEIYTNGFVMGGSNPYAICNLGGQYESMSFTLGHIDGSRMTDGAFNIYLDGELIDRIEVSCESLPKEYTISLNGAAQMKITKAGYDIFEKYGFGNVVVY